MLRERLRPAAADRASRMMPYLLLFLHAAAALRAGGPRINDGAIVARYSLANKVQHLSEVLGLEEGLSMPQVVARANEQIFSRGESDGTLLQQVDRLPGPAAAAQHTTMPGPPGELGTVIWSARTSRGLACGPRKRRG